LTVQLLIDKFLGTLTEGPERTDISIKDEKGEEEKSVYEQPSDQVVIHSVNCQELIGCSCTPKSESDRFSEERAAAIRRLHAGRNDRARRAKSIRQLDSKPQEAQQPKRDFFDPTMSEEDWDKLDGEEEDPGHE
jgi:hypothetical protein